MAARRKAASYPASRRAPAISTRTRSSGPCASASERRPSTQKAPAPRPGLFFCGGGRAAAWFHSGASPGTAARAGLLALGDGVLVDRRPEGNMLYWAVVFLVVALVAGAFGFFGIAGTAAYIAKVLFFVFIVIFVVSLLTGMGRRRR